ncbi:MAG: hypothetical protein KAQ99_06570, partial [Candidatus Aureabacteria bacterium]|nr:hypothetical protein [Candidatus Auribacterota bacterium]
NGTGWNTLGTQAPGANGQLQSFTLPANVPNDITTTAKAKVSTQEANSSINVNNESNTFRIIGTIDVTDPNTAVTLYVNDTTKYINWSTNGTVTPVDIIYSVNSGVTWYDIERNYTVSSAGEQSYNESAWNPIPDRKNESSCLVKIIHNMTGMSDINDTSDTAFTMFPVINVTKPEAGDSLYAGSDNATVNWTYTGTKIANVDILLYNNTSEWEFITTVSVGSEGSGNYTWPSFPEFKRTNRQIRLRDNVTQNVSDDSALFDIAARLVLSYPNASVAYWKTGTTGNAINWDYSALGSGSVHIQYSNDSGANWYNVTDNLQDAANGTYSWDIPGALPISNDFSIKVSDFSNPAVTNSTSPEFDMVANFNITTPEDGDVVYANSTYDVTWDNSSSIGVANVILEYSTSGTGGSWTNLINESDPNAVTANDGSYTWLDINDSVLGSNCYVKVRDPNNVNGTNMSNTSFRIRGIINVTNPQDGQSKEINEYYDVNWTVDGAVSTVKVEYSPDDGSSWATLSGIETATNLTYNWSIVPATEVTNNQGRVRVTDNDDAGCYNLSGGFFSITGSFAVLTPNATGIVMNHTGSEQYEVTWDVFGGVPTAQVRYSTTGVSGTYDNIIANVTATNESYNWTVPDEIGANLSIMVRDYDNPAVNDTSNNPFAIKGSIQVDYPNAASGNWTVNEVQYVNWTPTGNYTADVDIWYSNDSGTSWNYLGSQSPGINGNAQSFALPANVPDDITTTAQAQVSTNESNSSINVNGTYGTFRIMGTVDVVVPASGSVLYVNDTTKYINWTS